MISVGIVGGTGYTGVELLRILALHPEAEVKVITSRAEEGMRVADMYPNLREYFDLKFTAPDVGRLSECDLVFFATPNGVAMKSVPELLKANTKIVDLSADFRIKDHQLWTQWYGEEHACPELLEDAVYGMPEIHREALKSAKLVANPGCYPTAVQLGFLPLLENKLVDPTRLIADAKSGASGAGRQAKVGTLMCEVSASFKSYGASGHRHLPEIKEGLSEVAAEKVGLTFVPHLVPMIRGIEATLYADLKGDDVDLQKIYENRYRHEKFVDVLPWGSHPETRSVKGSNMCRMALHRQPDSNVIIVSCVIDNLVKGAAGQAVQNMNIMCGLEENAGLNIVALLP